MEPGAVGRGMRVEIPFIAGEMIFEGFQAWRGGVPSPQMPPSLCLLPPARVSLQDGNSEGKGVSVPKSECPPKAERACGRTDVVPTHPFLPGRFGVGIPRFGLG